MTARSPMAAACEAVAVARGARTGCTWRREARVCRALGRGVDAGQAERTSHKQLGGRRTCLSSGSIIISTAALAMASPTIRRRCGWERERAGAGWSPAVVPPLEPYETPALADALARRGASFSDVSGYHHRKLVAACCHHVGATPRPIPKPRDTPPTPV